MEVLKLQTGKVVSPIQIKFLTFESWVGYINLKTKGFPLIKLLVYPEEMHM